MVTAEQQKQASRKLTHWLENEKKIVTFRELSREIGCHVNAAKNLLLDYYEAHSSIAPTYLLTGNLLSTSTLATTALAEDRQQVTATQRVKIVDMDEMSDGERNSEDGDADGQMDTDQIWGNDHGDEAGISEGALKTGLARESEVIEPEEVKRWGVVLVQADDLEEKKALFDPETLNIHIYALAPQPVKDPAQYLVPNLALRSHASYHNPDLYGTITGAPLRSVEENVVKPMKDGAMDFSTGKKDSKADTKLVKDEKKDAPKAKEAPKPQAESAKPKPAAKTSAASKPSQSRPKKRIITSDDEEDEPASLSKPKLETTSSQVRAADAAAMEAMMGMDMDVDMDDELKSDPADVKAGSSKVKREHKDDGKDKAKAGIKRKRKVKRTVTTEDAKGYMVTTDRWSETSASGSDEEEAPPKSAATAAKKTAANVGNSSRASSSSVDTSDKRQGAPKPPPNRPAAGNAKKPGGQSTLAGFFKKK